MNAGFERVKQRAVVACVKVIF